MNLVKANNSFLDPFKCLPQVFSSKTDLFSGINAGYLGLNCRYKN